MADNILNIDIAFLEEELKKAATEEMDENIKISFIELKQAAINFLRAYNILSTNEDMFNRNYLKTLINGDPTNKNFIKGLRGSKQAFFLRSKYLLAFKFDKALNKFLEEIPKSILYVYDDGQGNVSTYKMSMTELAKRATKEGRINVSLNQLQSEHRQSLEESGELIDAEHVKKAQSAYSGATSRLNRFYEKAGYEQKQGGLLMWKLGKEWTVARVSNAGDLKEAYVAALMTEHKSNMDYLLDNSIGSPAYYDENLIAEFFKSHIQKVTNKAAIIEEDIITEQMQYGVKSAKAQMPSLQQYISVAEFISKQNTILSQDMIRSTINNMYSQNTARNKILGTINNLGEKTLNELLEIQNLEYKIMMQI